jgi:hypothetical protein
MSLITLHDVIASANVNNGHVLDVDLTKVKELQSNPVVYIPLVFINAAGNKQPCKIKIESQITASCAKQNEASKGKGIPKHVQVNFNKLSEEDLVGDFFDPRKFDTEEENKNELARISKNNKKYLSNNALFIECLNILENSFKYVCEQLINSSKKSELKFKLNKTMFKDIPILQFKQETLNKDKQANEELLNPIYRCRISVDKNTGKIGYMYAKKNEFIYTIFDLAKSIKEKGKNVPARNCIGKNKDGTPRYEDLNYENVGKFLTRFSEISAILTFDSISSSKSGLSISNSLSEIMTNRHNKVNKQSHSINEQLNMNGGIVPVDHDYETVLEELDDKKDKSSEDEDSEPDVEEPTKKEAPQDSDEEESEEEVKVEPVKKTVRKTKK